MRPQPQLRMAALAAAALVLACAGPVWAAGRTTSAAGTLPSSRDITNTKDPKNKKALEAMEPQYDLYTLPDGYRKPDGSFNQDALAAHEKKRLEVMNQKLSTKFTMFETPHYLIFSDADAPTTAQFVTWCEALYGNLCQQFAIDPKERVWDGKCALVLFHWRTKFEAYSRIFDGHVATDAGAYFARDDFGSHEPQLVHMCFPMDQHDVRYLQELFAHEGTHAFFEFYRKPGRLPLWLHEGLAEYMTVVNNPVLKSSKLTPAARIARTATSLGKIFKAKTPYDLEFDDYSVAYMLVDFLMAAGKPKFKKFIDTLKDGKDVEGKDADAALQAAYGFGQDELERRWRVYMNEYVPRHR